MIHVLTYSEVGGHRVNEDAFVARPHPVDPDSWLICLADGQGGRAGGAQASQLACKTAADLAAKAPADDLEGTERPTPQGLGHLPGVVGTGVVGGLPAWRGGHFQNSRVPATRDVLG